MIEIKENFPPKISNLRILKRGNFFVPPFYVLKKENVENIENEIGKIISFFKENLIQEIIIRSACVLEDLDKKSLAGFFESSSKILLKDLKTEDIKKIWQINEKKANDKELYLFIQHFYEFDCSGVLFTQNIYDDSEAILELSKTGSGITSGETADKTFLYEKENKKWIDGNQILNTKVKEEIAKLIDFLEENFKDGADVELGIKKDRLIIIQVRPISRNEDEKKLLLEKKRLSSIFGDNFKDQIWVKNNLTNTLGDLSSVSVDFYNSLLCSEKLNELLHGAKFIDRKVSKIEKLRILENIGGQTYFNDTQAKKIFPKKESFFSKFKSAILVGIFEPIVRQENELDKKNFKNPEEVFRWLFLSGIYFQFFLEYDKKRYRNDFNERLKNTEKLSEATQPFFHKESELNDFMEKFYYLSDYPYELTSPRIKELSKGEIMEKFFYNNLEDEKKETGKILSEKTYYWLKQKSYWKKNFLKILYKKREDLIGENRESENNYKINAAYEEISGLNFPFSKNSRDDLNENKEIIIVPGKINPAELIFLKENDDIFKYQGKFVAVDKFPNHWIPFIPKLRGIITKKGNELSHMSITCREYGVPYYISSKRFKRQII